MAQNFHTGLIKCKKKQKTFIQIEPLASEKTVIVVNLAIILATCITAQASEMSKGVIYEKS